MILFNMLIWFVLSLIIKMLILPGIFKSFYKGKRSTRSNLLVTGSPERNKSIASLLRRSSVYGRSRLPFDQTQFLDFLYTIDSSHSLDFRLMMKTIPVVLFGKGGV